MKNLLKWCILSNFLKKILEIFRNLIKFSTIFVFRPNARKINASHVKCFEKYAKIIHFRNFLKKILVVFRNLTQNFLTVCVFRPNAQKFNAWSVNFFENMQKMHFRNFLKDLFPKFSKVFPPETNSGYAYSCSKFIFCKKISKNWTYFAYSLDFVEKLFYKFNFYGLSQKSREIFDAFY